MVLLGVNIDHVATLREARKVTYPDPILAAKLAQAAGADQITCHLREDRRHIRDQDLPRLRDAVSIPINLEMAATEEMKAIALKYRPEKVTLVPEKRAEITTEGGLDVSSQVRYLTPFVQTLKEAGIFVSLFIDPEPTQIEESHGVGAQSVEIHTGNYCDVEETGREKQLLRLQEACQKAKAMGFFVAAGHGLNYQNIFPVKKIKEIEEFNIGHSIVAHAVIVGWERAVLEMKDLLHS